MVDYTLDEKASVLHVRPTGPLQERDFEGLAAAVDPFIARTGGLHGLILEAAHFPGWDDFGAVIRHFRFVRDHHKKVKRVAVVTDSRLGGVAEHLASHFISAEIKHFAATQGDAAWAWIAGTAERSGTEDPNPPGKSAE